MVSAAVAGGPAAPPRRRFLRPQQATSGRFLKPRVHEDQQALPAITPGHLLPFLGRPSAVGDRHFVRSHTGPQHLGRQLGVETESPSPTTSEPESAPTGKSFRQVCMSVMQESKSTFGHGGGETPAHSQSDRRGSRGLHTEYPCRKHMIGEPTEHRMQQGRDVRGRIFEIGVQDYDVGAGRCLHAGVDGGTLTAIRWMAHRRNTQIGRTAAAISGFHRCCHRQRR